MLYYLLYPLHEILPFLNVFRYITFRAAMAGITAFVVCLWIGPGVIRFLSKLNMKQTIERDGFAWTEIILEQPS